MAKANGKTATAGRGKAPVLEPEVIDQDGLQLTTMLGEAEAPLALKALEAFRSFSSGLAGFVTKAVALETKAATTLQRAGELKPAGTAAEDEALQVFIRSANQDRKEVEEHWTICSAVHRFHRQLTAKRDKSVKALEQAAAIAQRHHNTYTEAERRRAQEEEDRINRQREEEARQRRELELQEQERQALEREQQLEGLSEREARFVELVAYGYNSPATSARQAGYKDPEKQGERLMATPKIQAAIQAKKEAQAIRQQAEARRREPLVVDTVEVKPDITRAAGAVDRTTHSAELLNEAALISACIAGGHGIPHDILQVNPAKLNEYARSLHERINLWPGVRYKKTTKTV